METILDFKTLKGSPPGLGHRTRRAIFESACNYLGLSPTNVENIYGIGFHSVLHSDSVQLSGSILEKVKRDPAIVREQEKLLVEIFNDINFKIKRINRSGVFFTQLGGQRASTEMWKQALQFWRWTTKYSATWQTACDELTWAVRSNWVNYNCRVEPNGIISINYSFSGTLDLRPDWVNRSTGYNALCYILGFLYHDVIGGNHELKINANWKTEII